MLHEVEKPAGSGDDDVDATLQRILLRALADAAEDHGVTEAEVSAVGGEARADLAGELARRRDHEHADETVSLVTGCVEPLQDRQRKGRGLAGPRLGQAEQIAPGEDVWDRLHLDGRR